MDNAAFFIEYYTDAHGWERVDEVHGELEAWRMYYEYRIAYGLDAKLRMKHRGRIVG